MRRTSLACAVIALTAVAIILFASRQNDGTVKFAHLYPEIEKCRTTEQAIVVMGRPPGNHGLTDASYMMPSDYKPHGPGPAGQAFVDDSMYWAGDDCAIVVTHFADGTIHETRLVYPMPKKRWHKDVSEFLRGLVP